MRWDSQLGGEGERMSEGNSSKAPATGCTHRGQHLPRCRLGDAVSGASVPLRKAAHVHEALQGQVAP